MLNSFRWLDDVRYNNDLVKKSSGSVPRLAEERDEDARVLSLENGNVVVNLVNEAPKDLPNPKPASNAKPVEIKEVFDYPTPSDLTKQDLAPNKPKKKEEPKKKQEPKKKEGFFKRLFGGKKDN